MVHPGEFAWRVAAVAAGDDGKITDEQICSLPPSGQGGGGCSTDRPGQGQVCLSLASSSVPSQHTKILAWEDSSASKEVLGDAQVELAGSWERETSKPLARHAKLASSGQ